MDGMSDTNGLTDAAKRFYNPHTPPAVAARYVLVPVELTDKMNKLWAIKSSQWARREEIWRDLLAAAPPAPEAAPGALNDTKRQLRKALGLSQDFDDMTPEAMMLKAVERLAALKSERDALQARVDALMLEYCPDEMTPEQLEEWARHQKPGRTLAAKGQA